MERHHRQFEANAREDERKASEPVKVGRGVIDREQCRDPGEFHRAQPGIDQSHAEQQKCRRDARQNQVFDAGLQRFSVVARIGDQAEQRDAERFQTEEEGCEVIAGNQRGRAERRHQHEQIELLRLLAARGEITVGQQQDCDAGCEDQPHVEKRIAVDYEQRRYVARRHVTRWPDRDQTKDEAQQGEQRGQPVIAAKGNCQHHDRYGSAQDDERKNSGEINAVHGSPDAGRCSEATRCKLARPELAASKTGCG